MTLAILVLGATLDPGGLVMWLLVGLIAGFLASWVMHGAGYGLVGNLVVGIGGALLGGWLSGLLGFTSTYGLAGSLVIAILGSCILLAILHAFSRSRSRA
jgi:uncharacterized membrane protein YeaQ/YmgE (transglycosylase-associated protein family)